MSNGKGITISVTAETNAGGRRHMEDYLAVKLCPNERLRQVPHLREQAYIGVFDGHGGKEAAKFARERLWEVIQDQPKYQMNDIESVCESLREAFEALHKEMEPLRATWKTNKMGDLSTAGTTASTIIFRQNHIFVANVGDSTIVLAESNPRAEEPGQHAVIARVLTKDHKPDDPEETKQVERLGGRVMVSRKGVPRVVWERRRNGSINGDQVDFIPFLSVSRSLGDFWSFCPRSGKFVVSPRPDVYVHALNPKVQKFIIIASDGLWNVMSPKEVVEFIWDYEHEQDEKLHQPRDVVKAIINEALSRWNNKHLLADNIAVLIAFLSEDDSYSPSVANIVEEDAQSSVSTPSTVSPASTASPTPSSGSTDNEESSERHDSPTPPPTASPASPASLSKCPPSTSSSSPSPSAPPSSSSNQSQEQQLHSSEGGTINSVHTTKSGSTSHYKETFPDGVTVECHTKIKLRHRKKHQHHGSRSKVKAHSSNNSDTSGNTPSTSTSSYSLDPNGILKRSPLKRERSAEDVSANTESLPKRSKLDLPDSGCDCSADKMETEDSSPPNHIAATSLGDHDQASSSDHSSGVYSDDSEGKNKPAENCKSSDADSSSAVVEDVSSPVPSSAVSVS